MTTNFPDSPFGDSITADEILDNMGFLDDWEDRYRYIIDLGKSLPELPDNLKTEDNFVRGCQSQVWLVHHYDKDNNQLIMAVDSDALIVRGLAAMLLAALNKRSPEDIVKTNMEEYFGELDLLKHLSPTRGNGLRAMVQRIRQEASHCLQSS